MGRVALGIDLGGTNIKAGVVTEEGQVVYQERIPTRAEAGLAAVLDRIDDLACKVLRKAGVTIQELIGIGVGVPGTVDSAQAVIEHAPNLQWRRVPLRQLLEQKYQMPVLMDNDANAAAWGECWWGAARGEGDLLMVTLGTGIGSGLVLNGAIYRGAHGSAAEMGHMVINPSGEQCGCGARGCLETVASGPALVRAVRSAIAAGEPSSLIQAPELGVNVIFQAVDQGDSLAIQLVDRATRYLALALANVVNLLDPAMVVIGGGVAHAGPALFSPLQQHLDQCKIISGFPVKVVPAQLGNTAGLAGAAAMVLHREGTR